ncbi:hypothetical protein ACXGQW_10445 [Wenyingzhuangia sp. IMCC45533]
MKKFLLSTFKYSFICLFLVNAIAFSANYFLKKSSFYKPSFLVNTFDKRASFDYIVLGSSRGLTTIDTKQVDDKLMTNGLNLSMDDTDLKAHLLMFKHFISHHYKTRYCILNLDIQSFSSSKSTLGNNDYRFVPFSSYEYVQNHYFNYEQNALKPLYSSSYIPFLAYAYYNLELLPAAIIGGLKPLYRNRFDDRGNYSYPSIQKKLVVKNTITTNKTITNPILSEIQNLATENNIKLIIYIAPILNKSISVSGEYAFSIINHSDSIVKPSLFYDDIHVNKKGRKKATTVFINNFKALL